MMRKQMLPFQFARLTGCPVSLELPLFAFFFVITEGFENTSTLRSMRTLFRYLLLEKSDSYGNVLVYQNLPEGKTPF